MMYDEMDAKVAHKISKGIVRCKIKILKRMFILFHSIEVCVFVMGL